MKSALLSTLLLISGCLLGLSAQAQYQNAVVPKIITYKPGMYQLADGSWHTGQLYLEQAGQLRVRNPNDKVITEYQPVEVRLFTIEKDTFQVIRGVQISARRRLASAFAKQLYHYGNFTAFNLVHEATGVGAFMLASSGSTPAADLIVQGPTGDAVVVPGTRRAFEEAMLPLFGDCPEIAENIKRGKWGRQHMQKVLLSYAQWQQTAPKAPQ